MIDRDDGMRVLCIVGCVWVRELPNTPTSDTFEPGIGHNRLRTPTDFCKLQTHCNGTSTISKITIKQTMILVILFICGRYVCRSLSLNSLSCQWFSTIRELLIYGFHCPSSTFHRKLCLKCSQAAMSHCLLVTPSSLCRMSRSRREVAFAAEAASSESPLATE